MLLFFRHYRCLLERVRKSNEDDKEITYKNKRRTQFNNLINFDIIKLFLDFNTLCFLLKTPKKIIYKLGFSYLIL